MSIVKNENDQLPADAVEARAKTYETMMNVGYLAMLPVTLAFVVLIAAVLIGAGLGSGILYGVLTGVFVYFFAKTFFVH